MTLELTDLEKVVAVGTGLLAILGTIFGWFGKAWSWLRRRFTSRASTANIEIPSRTLILLPKNEARPFWWHMGSVGKEPAMQVVGHLTATNVSKFNVFVSGARLRKPRILGHPSVREFDGNTYGDFGVPERGMTDIGFDFWVVPPTKAIGEEFRANVAIVDQFGNEHWVKNISFRYQ